MSKLFEGSRAGDLDFLVAPKIHFDEFNSKMGKPDVIITASFKVKQREPAMDLVSFLESGYDWILDADISTGEVSDNEYLVFLEIQRKPDIVKKFSSLIEDLTHLTNINPEAWQFRWYKQKDYQNFTKENFDLTVPLTSEKYKESIDEFVRVEEQSKELAGDLGRLKKLSGIR